MARPTEYTEEIIDQTRDYIEQCVDEEDEFHKTRGEKSDGYDRLIRVRLPTIEGLAVHLKVNRDTIYDWETKYPEFSDILGELRAIQADRLLNNGLSGNYNPVIAKVLLTKHGYRDSQEVTGLNGKDLIPESISAEDKEKLLGLLK